MSPPPPFLSAEAVVTSLQENSIKMGQILAVHQEKLEQQEKADDILFEKIDHIHKDLHVKTDEIKKGCERDILMVKGQIESVEKKVYVMLGAVSCDQSHHQSKYDQDVETIAIDISTCYNGENGSNLG